MSSDTEVQSLWRFVSLAQYVKPPEPTTERVRRGLVGLWDRLRLYGKPVGNHADHLKLRLVMEDLLVQAVTEPDWQEAAPALDEVFKDWLKTSGIANPLQVVVGAPHSGICFMVGHWGDLKNWRVIDPPGAEYLLTGAKDWLMPLDPIEDSPWVIPCLEKWFLRHFNGLTILRELLTLLSSRRQPTLIACDSWGWAYLSRVASADLVLPSPLVLAAFDQPRLSRWFQELTHFPEGENWVFRLPGGDFVLPPPAGNTENARVGLADFLAKVAAHSRGIPGVAWALWRHALRFTPALKDEEPETRDEKPQRTMWVTPWNYLNLPKVPGKDRDRLGLILHTLLLHKGVSNRLLPELLPGLMPQLTQDLQGLRAAGLVEIVERTWRVTALGYPSVREFLQNKGYLVDAI